MLCQAARKSRGTTLQVRQLAVAQGPSTGSGGQRKISSLLRYSVGKLEVDLVCVRKDLKDSKRKIDSDEAGDEGVGDEEAFHEEEEEEDGKGG